MPRSATAPIAARPRDSNVTSIIGGDRASAAFYNPPVAGEPLRDDTPFARAGARLADFCERWFPDAFVFALLAVVVVFFVGLGVGERPAALAKAFAGSFWSLVPFTMQMALVIIGGFVVASSPPVAR